MVTYEQAIKQDTIRAFENDDFYTARLGIDLLDHDNITAERAMDIVKIMLDEFADSWGEDFLAEVPDYWLISLSKCSLESWATGDVLDTEVGVIV